MPDVIYHMIAGGEGGGSFVKEVKLPVFVKFTAFPFVNRKNLSVHWCYFPVVQLTVAVIWLLWPLTWVAQVHSMASLFMICGGQYGTGTSFSLSTSFSP